MNSLEGIEGLSECIGRAIQEHLAKSNINIAWPQIDSLSHPILRFEAFIEDAGPASAAMPHSARVASRTLDLAGMKTPRPSRSPTTDYQSFDSASSSQELQLRDDSESADEYEVVEATARMSHRKGTGGLRVAQGHSFGEDLSEHQRQMQVDGRMFPKRRKIVSEKFVFQPSTLDKLIVGIWEQVHGSIDLDPQAIFEQFQLPPNGNATIAHHIVQADIAAARVLSGTVEPTIGSFSQMNVFCRKVTQASRVCRSIEIVVQARWIEMFEEQVQVRACANPSFSATKHRRAVLMEACQDFGWSEKELRNKMAIWRGYKDVKDAAGWAALVFAGMGIYRFCKYRVGFDKEAMRRLRNLRKRLEVAADTLHPHWRELLEVVGESQALLYPGHPHEWVVYEDGSDPVPLRQTYQLHDPFFSFEHIEESIVDDSLWGCEDPRWMPQENTVTRAHGVYTCALCNGQQSDEPNWNSCFCFPSLFGCVKRKPPLVQVYSTGEGKNNGLVALTTFERGTAIGELVGLITNGVRHKDVMESSTPLATYQIWQGRVGNYTRFANHSCKANAQTSTFTWLDTQRILLVSKGIQAGTEITVDYGEKYWAGLDKACLCGETCCRYKRDGSR